MDRREFLITSGGAAVAATSAVAAHATEPGEASQTARETGARVLRLSMPWADTPQGPADSVRRLVRRFEIMTEGRYRIEISSQAQDVAADADLVHGTAHDFAGLHPAFAYFAGLPGSSGLGAQDFAHWIAVGGGQMLWDDLAGQHGWKPLLVGHSGEAPPLWSRQAIGGLGDLAGQRISAPGLGADVARALGAEAIPVAPDDIAAAIQDGRIFAAETGLLTALAGGVARSAHFATGTGLNGRGTALSLTVRLSVWESLPEHDRAILTAAAMEEYQASLAEGRAHEHVACRALAATFGITFAPWPSDVAEAIDRVAEATIAHVAGQDALAARIDQSYMAFRSALQGATPPKRVPGSVALS
ncbi:hypothetical protein [Hyphomicrobium sp.]|uniref:hypothetical protein n=1 Tax=Hyphomicrobium sp. TaxID=82 RepID=UPI002E322560|nr:hypothetical protein [Hyphomicrobium sp.]HEX2840219.1 hypothetical protein [Hyphomicrobium sp.]